MLGSASMITALSAISFALIAALLLTIIRAITAPMIASLGLIGSTMQDIWEGGGDLAARLGERGSDELSSISKSFNKLAGALHGMISSSSESTDKAAASFEELKGTAAGGREGIGAGQNLVSRPTAQSGSLLEANSAIDNIASRTSLTAMNSGIGTATAQIRDGSAEMDAGTATVAKEMARLSDSSRQAQNRSVSIASAASAISCAVREIVDASRANKEAIGAQAGITGKFRL